MRINKNSEYAISEKEWQEFCEAINCIISVTFGIAPILRDWEGTIVEDN